MTVLERWFYPFNITTRARESDIISRTQFMIHYWGSSHTRQLI